MILNNAGVDIDVRRLDEYGKYVYRDEMANIVVNAFPEKFPGYAYLYGNNIEIYKFLLRRLDRMNVAKQERYVERLIEKLAPFDHQLM